MKPSIPLSAARRPSLIRLAQRIGYGIIGGIFALSVFFFARFSLSKALQEYHGLTQQHAGEESSPLSYSQQLRSGVSKEIWYGEGRQLHVRLVSDESELFLFQNERSVDTIEEMRPVTGWMQEELYFILPDGREAVYKGQGKLQLRSSNPNDPASWVNPQLAGMIPMQHIRYFEAERARYDYASQRFSAEKVLLHSYRLKGHDIPQEMPTSSALLVGTAQMIECHFRGDNLNFRAHKWNASFDSTRGKL